jgi:exopolysaccharide production protein ExoY
MANALGNQPQHVSPVWARPRVSGAVESAMTAWHLPGAPSDSASSVAGQAGLGARRVNRPVGGAVKRAMDLVIATTALLLASPVMIIVALLINLTAGGAPIFSHNRVGFGGRQFKCYKFRSMVANSEAVLEAYLEANPEARREWEECRKIRNDPRVTLLGRMLRRSSLDELPQLFNIIRGDMSCVGPRPVVIDELKRYGDCMEDYLRARPGLTGLWQVSGRSNTDYASRVALDSRYVREWSIWLDIRILFRTILAVLRFDDAF